MWARYLSRIREFWFPALPREEKEPAGRALTRANLFREKIGAVCLAAVTLLAAGLDLRRALSGAEPLRPAALESLVLRLILLAALAGFAVLVRRVGSRDEAWPRQRALDFGLTVFLAAWSAVLTGLGQRAGAGLTVYLIVVFSLAAFVYQDGPRSLLVYGLSLTLLALGLLRYQPETRLAWAHLMSGTLAALLALLITRLLYVTRLRDFAAGGLTERQQRELEEANQRLGEANVMLKRLSFIDALTEIPNRRYFDEFLAQEWGRAARDDQALSLILIDIDHFKKFNDAYGHQAGDECLKWVAAFLATVARRPGDLVARYGGEEFAVVLPGAGLRGAVKMAEKMRLAVAGMKIEHSASPLGRVTISLGLASRPRGVRGEPEQLIEAADKALYRAKAGGRNRVCWPDVREVSALP